MATKIVTKNSSTAGSAPSASDLVQGELAVNVADKRLYTEDNAGNIVELGTNPSTIDINGGTIDGTVIGAASASTGAFTTLSASGVFTGASLDISGDIDVSGKVGIGTSSPAETLQINHATAPKMRFDRNGAYYWDIGHFGSDFQFESQTGGTILHLNFDGNVGIGTISPDAKLHVQDSVGSPQIRIDNQGTASGVASLLFRSGGAGNPSSIIQSGGTSSGNQGIVFKHGAFGAEVERMRIDSSGNLLVGTTDTDPSNNGALGDAGHALSPTGYISSSRSGGSVALFNRMDSDGDIVAFRKDGAVVGSVAVTGSATAYNTSSDQRLKENIADADDAGSKIDAIQVRKYDWKADGSHQDYGMIAQELQAVAPEAVSVPEDSEEMMGVDYSKLVPMLIKEIQSLRQRVASLEE